MRDYRGPDGFAPLHVVGAEGYRIRLADGRELLDAISSWWCKSLGHGHRRLRQALIDQAHRFEHVILANTTNEPIVRLCERLLAAANGAGTVANQPLAESAGMVGGHFTRVFFADNGSTAVEIAIKMAVQAQAQRGRPHRTRLAALANGYHGETAAALSVSDCDLYRQHYAPLLFDVPKLGPLPYRSGPDDRLWLDASDAWPAIERQLDPLAGTLAAIVYEPVLQGAGNMRLYSPDLLARLGAWADAHDVLLIADEIAAGCHRLGPFLASMHSPQARPADFVCLSKGLTGGFLPLSAVLTTEPIYDAFDADYAEFKAFLHSNTYTGNALGVAVAHAALDTYEAEAIPDHVAAHGPLLVRGLAELARTRPHLHGVRGCGMMAAVDLREPDGSPLASDRRTGYRVYRAAVDHPRQPALLRPIGDTMYLFPPLNTRPADIDATLATLADAIDAVLPG
jgi:adenosylmethionine-8-amino-7-oxononanoate aminotransferase